MTDLTTIVVTGGPCAGKTSFLTGARRFLEDRGYFVGIVPEAATEIISAGFNPQAEWTSWKGKNSFQYLLLSHMISRAALYRDFMEYRETNRKKVLIFDRAEMDHLAYLSKDEFRAICDNMDLVPEKLKHQYDAVLHLVTAADGARKFYTLANNEARYESADEAVLSDQRLRAAWNGHPHRFVVDNSTNFEGKMVRALQYLARVLHLPEPQEIERKWVVESLEDFIFPSDTVSVEISQTYLTAPLGMERRVRRRTVDGVITYYYTEKSPSYVAGIRYEKEKRIQNDEYMTLLSDADPTRATVEKTRHTFIHDGLVMEWDVFHGPFDGLIILEVEIPSLDTLVTIPPGPIYREVTKDPSFTNHALAKAARIPTG